MSCRFAAHFLRINLFTAYLLRIWCVSNAD